MTKLISLFFNITQWQVGSGVSSGVDTGDSRLVAIASNRCSHGQPAHKDWTLSQAGQLVDFLI